MEKIEINGIQRFQDGINTDSGTCDEIINLRQKDGQWVLMNDKEEVYDLTGTLHLEYLTLWYNHPVTSANMFIAYDTLSTANDIVEIDGSTQTSQILLGLATGEVCSKIYHFGNFLIVVTDLSSYYLRFDNDTTSYTLLPDIPHGVYNFATSDDSDSIEDIYYSGTEPDLGSYTMPGFWDIAFPTLIAKINSLREDGFFQGHTFFRLAYRTSDGNYILPTTPYYYHIGMPEFDGTVSDNDWQFNPLLESILVPGVAFGSEVTIKWLNWSKPELKLTFTAQQLLDLAKYDGLITSLCIFMTDPLTDRDVYVDSEDIIVYQETDIGGGTMRRRYSFPYTKNLDKLFDLPKSYYLVDEIRVSALQLSENKIITVDNLAEIETKENLPIDEFTHHSYFSQVMYEYNSRLHMGNVKSKLSGGVSNVVSLFSPEEDYHLLIPPSLSGSTLTAVLPTAINFTIHTLVKIKTEEGERLVLMEEAEITIYSDGDFYLPLNSVLIYPDSRATSIQYLALYSGDYYDLTGEIELIGHPYFNFAYNLDDYHSWENATESYMGLRIFSYRMIYIAQPLLVGDIVTFTENIYTTDLNRVQVSGLNSILYFPAENSYRIGRVTNTVTGIMSQATPMSEGQYGYFPLMVFSDEGVFSLEQGSGDILYQSIQPVSLDVVTNPDSIVAVDSGIMFVSEKGLMVLSGRKSIEISEIMEGTPKSLITSDTNYSDAIDGTDSVVTLDSAISTVDFMEYLEEAIIAYDQVRDEILVSNTKTSAGAKVYGYSYIFSIKQKVWFKTSQTFSHFIRNHPNWFAIEGSSIYNFDEGTGDRDWMIKTNPFKFGVNDFKMIERLVARFDFSAIASSKAMSFYVYGSLDNKEWKLITGIKPDIAVGGPGSNLMLRKIRTTARYFIIFMASSAYSVVHSGFEANVKVKIPEKVR